MSRLSVELVPATCWYTNVRSNVTRAEWEKCKRYVRTRSGDRCEICGGVGPAWPVEAHEIWHYDDETQVQTLVDLIALCPPCHRVKHIARTATVGGAEVFERSFRHLATINGWTDDHTARYLQVQHQIWQIRSTMPWRLDLSLLDALGIGAPATGLV